MEHACEKIYNIIYINDMSVNHVINYHIKFMYHKFKFQKENIYSKYVRAL